MLPWCIQYAYVRILTLKSTSEITQVWVIYTDCVTLRYET